MDWSPIARVYDPLKVGSIDGTDTEPHDHGVVRAIRAQYRPNKQVCGDPKLTLFVARLNPSTTEETVKAFFSRFGTVRHCRLVRDLVTGYSKCYAFVEFKDRQSANLAYKDSHKAVLEDHEIMVDFESERTLPGWVPRRLGGGFGGKKESGQLRFGGRDRPFKKPITVPTENRFFERRNFRRDQDKPRYTERYDRSSRYRSDERRPRDRYE